MRSCLNVWLFIIVFCLIVEYIHPLGGAVLIISVLSWKLWTTIWNLGLRRQNKVITSSEEPPKENPQNVDSFKKELEELKFSYFTEKAKEVNKKKPKHTNRDKRTSLQKEIDVLRGFSKTPLESIKPKSTKKRISTKTTTTQSEIQFWYTDIEGNVTFRNVKVTSLDSEYLKGFDLDKRANRTFKIERIDDEIIDVSTGEILSKRDWLRLF
ncbi:TPA: hypothetical protein ACK3JR_002170 [Mannheimia haemolytica]